MPAASQVSRVSRFHTGSRAREIVDENRIAAETQERHVAAMRDSRRAEDDRSYRARLRPWYVRAALALPPIRSLVCTFAKSSVSRAYETGVIDAKQYHLVADLIDRRLGCGHQP